MSKFIKYENIDFRINNSIFYSTSVEISMQTNIEPVLLSDGSLLRYAPQQTIIGSLNTEFFLTSSFPSFLSPTLASESPVNVVFAGVQIQNCYLKSISFQATQFSPISLSAEFDWYGQINSTDSTNNLKPFDSKRNTSLSEISHSNRSYISDLTNVFGFSEIFGFQYSEQCNRIPFFKNGEIVPFRVAKTNKVKSVTVDGNFFKQNNVNNIEGKDVSCDLFLKNYNNTLINTFSVSGKIESRGLSVSNNGILQSKLSIMQRLAPLRSSL
jgi:hypothetical protein